MLTPVTLLGMDDKPAIEYHPFGTITLNFDDGPVKLRRCRLGDLEYAKNLLAELREQGAEIREPVSAEVAELLPIVTSDYDRLDPDVVELRTKQVAQFNDASSRLQDLRTDLIYNWLSQVVERMGDTPAPVKEEWPLDLFGQFTPNDVLDHWQNRPLVSGRISQNGTITEAAKSEPPQLTPSSPPAPLPQ